MTEDDTADEYDIFLLEVKAYMYGITEKTRVSHMVVHSGRDMCMLKHIVSNRTPSPPPVG